MRLKDINLEQLPTFVAGADEYKSPNGQMQLWGFGDNSWVLHRAGDENALLLEPDYDDDIADVTELEPDLDELIEAEQNAAIRAEITQGRAALRPGVVPRATGKAWAEIIQTAVWADADADIDLDDVVLELLSLGCPEPILELFDWTRGARAAA